MGLQVAMLGDRRVENTRDCFVYGLYYGADEPITAALLSYLEKMRLVIQNATGNCPYLGTNEGWHHFGNNVFSYETINGENCVAEQLLPALLITNLPPAYFRWPQAPKYAETREQKFVLVPIRRFCSSPNDVALHAIPVIGRMFDDVESGRHLAHFRVVREKTSTVDKTCIKFMVVEPTTDENSIDIRASLGLPHTMSTACNTHAHQDADKKVQLGLTSKRVAIGRNNHLGWLVICDGKDVKVGCRTFLLLLAHVISADLGEAGINPHKPQINGKDIENWYEKSSLKGMQKRAQQVNNAFNAVGARLLQPVPRTQGQTHYRLVRNIDVKWEDLKNVANDEDVQALINIWRTASKNSKKPSVFCHFRRQLTPPEQGTNTLYTVCVPFESPVFHGVFFDYRRAH